MSGVVVGGASDGICEESVSGGEFSVFAVSLDRFLAMCFGCDAGGGHPRVRNWCWSLRGDVPAYSPVCLHVAACVTILSTLHGVLGARSHDPHQFSVFSRNGRHGAVASPHTLFGDGGAGHFHRYLETLRGPQRALSLLEQHCGCRFL